VRGPLLDAIRKLSLTERIQLVEGVRDAIAAQGEEFPVPESPRAERARRREGHRQGPEDVVPWQEVRPQLWAGE
jgi:putative addiction module component (TIGR02574 family)